VLERRRLALVPDETCVEYRRFVAAGFRRGLRSVVPGRTLRALRVLGTAPRELDAHQWAALFRASKSRSHPGDERCSAKPS
jgi:hypothetical protein